MKKYFTQKVIIVMLLFSAVSLCAGGIVWTIVSSTQHQSKPTEEAPKGDAEEEIIPLKLKDFKYTPIGWDYKQLLNEYGDSTEIDTPESTFEVPNYNDLLSITDVVCTPNYFLVTLSFSILDSNLKDVELSTARGTVEVGPVESGESIIVKFKRVDDEETFVIEKAKWKEDSRTFKDIHEFNWKVKKVGANSVQARVPGVYAVYNDNYERLALSYFGMMETRTIPFGAEYYREVCYEDE